MDKLTSYKTGLCLSFVVALTNFVGWGFIFFQSPHLATRVSVILIFAVSLLFCFGVWVQSVIACSIGVLWLVVWSGALVWPLFSSPLNSAVVAVYFVISAALNLLTAGIMLSKNFRTEFSYEREHQPKYKLHLKRLVFGAVVVAMLIATFNDILKLASS